MGNIASGIGRFFSSYDQKGLATLPQKSRKLAWFSKVAYNRNPPMEHAGFKRILNNPSVKGYVNDTTKELVIAIRGTEKTDLRDIQTNIKVAIDSELQTDRFKTADFWVRKLMDKYGGYKLILTGHSLGGGIVYRLADKYKNATGEVFNPAVNLTTLRDADGTSSRIKAHIIHGDPVAGVMGRPLKNTQVYSPAYGKEREQIRAMPIEKRLLYLHELNRFPNV